MSSVKHGYARRGAKSAEYLIWVSLRQRCNNPRNKKFADYGGRGITVSPLWDSFDRFLADVGNRPSPAHSIDRIDNQFGYRPDNCRWATAIEQASHTRRNVIVVINGETMILRDAVKVLGVRYGNVTSRLHRGWPLNKALGIAP